MKYIYIGKIVNTHGIKGEVRILSDFRYKADVFNNGINLYIGENKDKQIINTYRVHKDFDMVTFNGIENINDVLKYKGKKVYINDEEIIFNGILDSEIIGMDVYTNDEFIGKVTEIRKNPGNDLLVIDNKILIPYIDEFVKLEKDKVIINNMEGLI